jgi:uncharacterized membrane protein
MTRKLMIGASLATAATVGLLAVAGMANAQDGDGWPGPGMGGRPNSRLDHDGRHFMIGGFVIFGVVVALVGLAVWLILRRRTAPVAVGAPVAAPHISPTAGAEAILAERLARSEISADDYRTTLTALRDPFMPSNPLTAEGDAVS